jgi:DNA-binding NarL/FixJ family response regulator
MTRVIIADDHPIVRSGLKQIVAEASDIDMVDEVDSAEDLMNKLGQNRYDVVILDITLPGMDGLEALKRIRHLYPELPVLILSMHSEEQFAHRTLQAGASGFLSKTSAPNELVKAIRKIAVGQKYLSSSFVDKLVSLPLKNHRRLPHERLSQREFQVFCLIAQGRPISDIAKELSLSPKTVSTYRARISEKMMLETTAELIAYAMSNHLCH